MNKVLIPTYLEDFNCIGPACEDTCCAGWQVTVDEKTFKKYKKLKTSTLKKSIEKSLKRNRQNPNFFSYGSIKLDKKGACPLLTPNGLCSIHAELGGNYLSHTCSTYPRYTHQLNGIFEQSLTVSCPEAARLALTNPMGIDFIEAKLPSSPWIELVKNTTAHNLWPLRIAAIRLLQQSHTSIENRLITLGLFLQKIQNEPPNNEHAFEQTIQTYEQRLTQSEYIQQLAKLPLNTAFQLEMMTVITNQRSTIIHQRFLECLNETIVGLHLNDENYTNDDKINLYTEIKNGAYQIFISKHEYLLENYLVNHVFKELFPLDEDSFFKSYQKMLTYFILIKFHLVGMSNFHDNLSEEQAIQLIQSFSRVTEHNQSYVQQILNLFEKMEFSGIGHLVPLIQ